MAWPAPTTAPWSQAPPDLMSMTSYTPEQWAVMQQQNWQQWSQWQQQYAQWQSQYGEKYAEQLQTMQMMRAMPPLPPMNVAPPAPPGPPPPDQPPPPPHQNDQPLFEQPKNPGLVQNIYEEYGSKNNTNSNIDSYWANNRQSSNNQTPLLANSEALKKLAEEEHVFDLQFKKWEEEIEKWKRDNINHPDKEAYKNYELKFESCRAQLLERRKQMNLKRASLLNNPALSGKPQQLENEPINNVVPNVDTVNRNLVHIPTNQSFNMNRPPTRDMIHNNQTRRLPNVISNDQYGSHYNDNSQYVSHSDANFLPTNESNKGIPGLDLVTDTERPVQKSMKPPEIIDITDELTENSQPKAHDYTAISKGINNILGDEKIMNILSMVRGQNVPQQDDNNIFNQNRNELYKHGDIQMDIQKNIENTYSGNNQWNPYNNLQNNQKFDLSQGGTYHRPVQNKMHYQNDRGFNGQHQNTQRHDLIHQGSYHPPVDRNTQYSRNPEFGKNNIGFPNVPHPQNTPNRDVNVKEHNQPGHQQNNWRETRPLHGTVPEKNPYLGNIESIPTRPPEVKWPDEPVFVPSIIVEYEHKSLRLKARDFIEPAHTFDYNHKSKDDEYKSVGFDKIELEFLKGKGDLINTDNVKSDFHADDRSKYSDSHSKDITSRDYETRSKLPDRETGRDDWYSRGGSRDFRDERRRFDDRRKHDDRYDDKRRYYDDDRKRFDDDRRRYDDDRTRFDYKYDDRRRDDRESFTRRDNIRDRYKMDRNDDIRRRSDSKEMELRKRGTSNERGISEKRFKEDIVTSGNSQATTKHIVMIDDLLESPGREMRPEKIVIILRGPPGSGKSYLAKLIRDKEAEHGGSARIMSIDDYFMQEGEIEERDSATGKMIKKSLIKYEYDESLEESYHNSLIRAFKRTITDGYFTFLIFDAVNDQLKSYAEIWNYSRQNGFQVYICTMELDAQLCFKRNIHNRKLEDIKAICSRFGPTPNHHITLDATTLLQNAAIQLVDMEDVDSDDDVTMEDVQEPELVSLYMLIKSQDSPSQVESSFISKWEKMDDAHQLARLDGTSKPLRSSQLSMEDYLQLDDWQPVHKAQPGKKTVRWADIEERRQQEKMRAIGFVVGQTDWNRMTDPTMGSSALTQTKYIERVRRF